MLLLNDIYLKSKENQTFKPSSICSHYHVGHQLCTVLLKFGFIKQLERAKYLYIGKPIDQQLVNEVYNHYSKYKSDQKRQLNIKREINFNKQDNDLSSNIHSLAGEIKGLEQRIIQLNTLVMNMILEAPSKEKSFLHKIFNK